MGNIELSVTGNPNYCAQMVEITNTHELENCDNIKGTLINGINHVIISRDTQIGNLGIYFPVECAILHDFLSVNNLYSSAEMNTDKTKTGFFGKNGRVRAVKLRGHVSDGFWIPISSLYYAFARDWIEDSFINGISFDTMESIQPKTKVVLCWKYFVPEKIKSSTIVDIKKEQGFDKLIDGQFRFHFETEALEKHIEEILPNDWLSISLKVHGISAIIANVLTRRQLSLKERIAKKFGVSVVETQYEHIFSSRKVIKNRYRNTKLDNDIADIWVLAGRELMPICTDGMTIYYEIVGFLPNGGFVQKKYDYGCKQGEHKIYVYRITFTNAAGRVYEWGMRQISDYINFMKGSGFIGDNVYCVLIFDEGKAEYLYKNLLHANNRPVGPFDSIDFLQNLKEMYLDKESIFCQNKVPEEGIVVRKESLPNIVSYKLKSFAFKERETKSLDNGEINIEDTGEIEESPPQKKSS
ncbi:MAG: hypothetical protein LBT84_02335 [Spirochaetia bacterium]|jgi:hypothetical protein|nr:hypothetical protein [Spirochaetia bacterium]